MNPKISVILFSYNFEHYIAECMESIIHQTLAPFEIIICDDCSTDGTWDIIAAYAARHPLIRAFRHAENIGSQRNCAFGYAQVRGEYLSSLDGDDRWHPRKLERELQALSENPGVKVAYSNVRVIDAHGHPLKEWENGASGDLFYRIFWMKVFSTTDNIFRNELMHRSVYEAVGGYDYSTELLLDLDLKYRIAAQFQIVCTGETLVDYRIHGGGIHQQRAPEVFGRDNVKILKKILPLASQRQGPEAEEMYREAQRRIGIMEAQLRYHLTDQVPYAELCQASVGFAGRDVLEVGGPLPEAYVFEQLKARSWTSVACGETDPTGQGHPDRIGDSARDISQTPTGTQPGSAAPSAGEYRTLRERIEDLSDRHDGRYDLIFSIAGFERIALFPRALDNMYRALKPGGKVFALFAPLWSAHDGHHLPEMKDQHGQIFTSRTSPIPPWAHLIMRPADLGWHLYALTDKETADQIVYHVYNSPAINRFFTEDYLRFFKASRFKIIKHENMSFVQTQARTQALLEALYPGRASFTNSGLQVILEKPLADPGNLAESLYWNQRGEDLFAQGREHEALDMVTKAIEAHRGNAAAYNNLAVLLWHEGEIRGALENFRRSLTIEPDHKDAVINCANCLKGIGDQAEAHRLCRAYLQRHPGDPEVSQILACLKAWP